MGKHNGKARKAGLPVGASLKNKARREGKTNPSLAHLHTTDLGDGHNMQSVLETNDLDELMTMASLAGRDFSAEKQHVIVISTGAVEPMDRARREAERRAAEDKHRHRLRLPRRPAWSPNTSPDELDATERSSFYEWRRDLAGLEQEEHLVLTPFEKNLEVWRQLWRVLERSDIVVQVLDARDPLTYRSPDLERYALELHPTKRSLLLLNKADLLPAALRVAWADYFDRQGLDYVFWSAKVATEEQAEEGAVARAHRQEGGDPRARVLGVDELLDYLERKAQAAVDEAAALSAARAGRGERLVVGLIGYPNVGKSSTINALFGAKKTAVAATPGKTKHFQTLNVSDTLCLCDCPGLVLPQYAHSKAEMVAAGVIPIDRLTDYRGPLEAVAQRIPRPQLEATYGLRLPAPGRDEDPHRPPTPQELLRAFASARGWVGPSGLPDETRCSRRILKDYVDGKLLYCKPPPGSGLEPYTGVVRPRQHHSHHPHHHPLSPRHAAATTAAGAGPAGSGEPAVAAAPADAAEAGPSTSAAAAAASAEPPAAAEGDPAAAAAAEPAAEGDGLGERGKLSDGELEGGGDEGEANGALQLDAADLELLEELELAGGKKAKPVRPEHKFQKKAARSKGSRGQRRDGAEGFDGASLPMGKRGGLVRVTGY